MDNSIKNHYTQEDIERQYIDKDITYWKEELECINAEVTFFKKLLKNKTDVNDTKNYQALFEKLEKKQLDNKLALVSLLDYTKKLQGINECEDLDCETYYLNDHIVFKEKIESFLFKYRKLKRAIFSKLNKSY